MIVNIIFLPDCDIVRLLKVISHSELISELPRYWEQNQVSNGHCPSVFVLINSGTLIMVTINLKYSLKQKEYCVSVVCQIYFFVNISIVFHMHAVLVKLRLLLLRL